MRGGTRVVHGSQEVKGIRDWWVRDGQERAARWHGKPGCGGDSAHLCMILMKWLMVEAADEIGYGDQESLNEVEIAAAAKIAASVGTGPDCDSDCCDRARWIGWVGATRPTRIRSENLDAVEAKLDQLDCLRIRGRR